MSILLISLYQLLIRWFHYYLYYIFRYNYQKNVLNLLVNILVLKCNIIIRFKNIVLKSLQGLKKYKLFRNQDTMSTFFTMVLFDMRTYIIL